MSKLNWKSIVGWVVAIAVIFGIVGYNAYQDKKTVEGKFVVALNLPITGALSLFTEPYIQGLQMGIKDELETHNIPSDSVEILMGDNKGSSAESVSLFHYQNLKHIDVYISGFAYATRAVENLVAEHRIPHFIIAFQEDLVKDFPNHIRILPNYGIEQKLFVDFLKKKNPKKVFIFSNTDPAFSEVISKYFIPFLKENNINYQHEQVDTGFREFRVLAQKLEKYRPDVILNLAFSYELKNFLEKLRTYDLISNQNSYWDLDFMDLIYSEKDIEMQKGVVFTATEFDLDTNSFQNDLKEKYVKLYGKKPPYQFAYGYDTGRLIIKAYAKNGKVDVKNILEQTPYEGVSGKIELDRQTRDLKSTLIPATLDEKGKIVPVEE